MKKRIRLIFPLALLLLLLVIAGLPDSSYAKSAFDPHLNAVYTASKTLTIRTKPSKSAKKVASLKKGKEVLVAEQDGNFVRVKSGKKTGWVMLKKNDRYLLKRKTDGWIKLDQKWYYRKTNQNVTYQSNSVYEFNRDCYKIPGKSNFMLWFDYNKHQSITFYRVDGRWYLDRIRTANGGMEDFRTPCGVHTVFKILPSFHKHGFEYLNAFKFWMKGDEGGCFVHSQAVDPNTHKPIANLAGLDSTHGCISIPLDQSKWLKSRMKVGSHIVVIDRRFKKYKHYSRK